MKNKKIKKKSIPPSKDKIKLYEKNKLYKTQGKCNYSYICKATKKKQLCTYTYKCPSKKSKDDFKRGKCKYTYKCYPKKNKQLCKYTYKQCKPAKLINGNKKLSFKPYHYMVTER